MSEDRKNRIAEFFRSERSRLVNYARRLIADAADRDAEDLVQDVMLGILEGPDLAAPIQNLAAYIYVAVRNRIVDIMRSRKREVSIDASGPKGGPALADVVRDVRYDAATDAERNEIRQRLFAAIDSLRPEDRAVIVLTEFEGRSFRELSDLWGVPIGTLLSRKSRAMASVRRSLAGYYAAVKEEQ
jgi:RNA polymerase sigma factor (sigma-70 family)